MKFADVTQTILALCETSASFPEKAEAVQNKILALSLEDLLDHLDNAGIIPESFDHDSTEEKLFAKYCDALFARACTELGLKSSVIEARADTADVEAAGDGYNLVGDAKAFRLSRTAKNQKDFKVEALNQWRKGADYAALLAPLYQYPRKTSQIYSQACRYNVTLFSYTHLAYLIRHGVHDPSAFRDLLEVGKNLPASSSAEPYWSAIASAVCRITNTDLAGWTEAVRARYDRLPSQAEIEIQHWEATKARIAKLPHDEAVAMLIGALKIDAKIVTIRKMGSSRPSE